MKKILPFIGIAAVLVAVLLAACNSNPKVNAESTKVTFEDTVGLSAFKNWKAENASVLYVQGNEVASSRPATKTRTYSTAARRTTSTASKSGTMTSQSQYPAKTVTKKGWSKAAKGAVIGGVGGAVAGAIINKKNRAAGAVIGGVIGAAGGYGVGRHMDKKDGRVNLASF